MLMTTEIVSVSGQPSLPVSPDELQALLVKYKPPSIVADAGPYAEFAYAEFFSSKIRNPNTRKAYRRNVDRFLGWCDERGLAWQQILSPVIAEYFDTYLVKDTGQPLSDEAKKQHLAALRKFYKHQERRHGVVFNPTLSVEGPKIKVGRGKTPRFLNGQVKKLLATLDTTTLVGKRDRAILAVLHWTARRASEVANVRLGDYYCDGERWWFAFSGKGGKTKAIKVNHTLQVYLEAYLEATGIGEDPKDWPLFRSVIKRQKGVKPYIPRLTPYEPPVPSEQRNAQGVLTGNEILRMVKRRLKDAGLPADTFTPHSFRATTATQLDKKGKPRKLIQSFLDHADARTTALYCHTEDEEAQDLVDEITL